MVFRLLLIISISIFFLSSSAQYDEGTVIFSETGNYFIPIQKLYKIDDFNGDGYIDIIMIKPEPSNYAVNLTWYKNNAGETFSEQTSLLNIEETVYGIEDIFLEDINKDGINDIIFQNNGYGRLIKLFNDGYGNVKKLIENEVFMEDSINISLKDVADMDGDGYVDYIFSKSKNLIINNVVVGYNDGGGLISGFRYINTNNRFFSQLEAADIDGDNDLDIIGGTNAIWVYENLQENGFMFKPEIIKNNDTVLPIDQFKRTIQFKLRDIDNDNDAELLVESAAFENLSDIAHPFFVSHTHQFKVLDYNRQKEAFFTLETYDSWLHNYTLQLYENIIFSYDKLFSVQFGHQNNDDNLDALSVNVAKGQLLWYLGDGKGGFESDQSQVVHSSNDYSNYIPAIRLADVDNDGDLDVFVLLITDTSSTLTVFKNETPVSVNSHNFVLGKMAISPNPVNGNSYIQLSLEQESNLYGATYNLYNIDGVKLTTGNIKDSRLFIPNLPLGIIIIELNIDNQTYVEKILIE